ncbi:MAG: hypothetical protein BJ554DRAFT_1489 [Olpidium bornovanus]|uniref:Uncharacterized protein n=1 Tax=Olpidium bornovanus TaxID=278681 RepID=A0A8H7ZRJ1_9FUNG|nr:MAG: hypothetical protein BJ554DRAFT_1489 [Olpidium bornovanus]
MGDDYSYPPGSLAALADLLAPKPNNAPTVRGTRKPAQVRGLGDAWGVRRRFASSAVSDALVPGRPQLTAKPAAPQADHPPTSSRNIWTQAEAEVATNPINVNDSRAIPEWVSFLSGLYTCWSLTQKNPSFR